MRAKLLAAWAAVAPLLTVGTASYALAYRYEVPSASMEPTLLIGDQLAGLHFSYGYSTANLPFGNWLPRGGRVFGRLPERGDVVVFRAPANPGDTWVKRVIGLPGDRIALRGGRVWLNGRELPWRDKGVSFEEAADGGHRPAERFAETLPGGRVHDVLKMVSDDPLDDVPELVVPAGRLFVMGDNRDDSADSRVPVAEGGVGLLPVWNLEGRVGAVLWSVKGENLLGLIGRYRMGRFLLTQL